MNQPEPPPQLHADTERLGTDPLGKLLFRLSLPSIISMVTMSLYSLVDVFWVAKLGHEAVAALTVLMPFYVLIFAVGAGTGVGINALAARRFGERDTEAAHKAAGQVLPLSLLAGGLFVIVALAFTGAILKLAGATADLIEPGTAYLRMLAPGMPFLIMGLIGRNVFHAAGDAVRPMIFTIFGGVMNVILDPFFIFGWWFFPEMGISGAALATVIANGLSMALMVYFLFTNRTPYRFRPHHFTPSLPVIRTIYRVGLPSMAMETTESIVFVLFNHVVAGFGSVALAAMGIAGRISDLAFMIMVGTSHGLLPIVAYALGAKQWQRLWGAVRLASIWMAALMAVMTVLLEVFAAQTVGLFNRDAELVAIAAPGMRIFISTLVLVGPTIMFITTFQGLGKGKDALFLSLARQIFFFLPALYGLSALMGLTGVWLSLPVSDILGMTTSGLWLWREYRRQRKSGEWQQAPGIAVTPPAQG